jgi:hypothetical protein
MDCRAGASPQATNCCEQGNCPRGLLGKSLGNFMFCSVQFLPAARKRERQEHSPAPANFVRSGLSRSAMAARSRSHEAMILTRARPRQCRPGSGPVRLFEELGLRRSCPTSRRGARSGNLSSVSSRLPPTSLASPRRISENKLETIVIIVWLCSCLVEAVGTGGARARLT